ncbi:iron-sulfur cluster carrier protein ApbC [Rhodovibrio salinarum]|uniref:Iron-sulfur cluster carrier protein n=1 Tax=Rhodovibrio salinarum TaxID=1087 RepID=A0A934QKU0_9PROT|nr:iron-sulfur cluster carrier protein ApbC [Rhodovibrio salinarum]MBK1698751.1 iron-sulfur cluster carrier protein ApbC [Rhodovibrio salinarum]
MSGVTEESIWTALRSVQDPEAGQDIVSLQMVSGLVIKDGNVGFAIEVDSRKGQEKEPLRKEAEGAVRALKGVQSVTAVLTAHAQAPGRQAPGSGPTSQGTRTQTSHGPRSGGAGQPNDSHQQRSSGSGAGGQQQIAVPGVKAIVAVASGKGGVGKSTTAANLALAFQRQGHATGILDADIYGPSQPRMMGVSGRPESPDGKRLRPMEAYGVKVMSMGFLVGEDTPMIWRGPMVQSAIQQMLRDVDWGELDVLVVDMPPGTGDAQLTLAQQVPLAGSVIITTPQDISLLDAKKGLNMFRKVDVPVFGMVENMSYYLCPHCGERSDIFSAGGGRREAEKMGTELLGEIPLDIVIRETSDGGQPVVVSHPESAHAQAYLSIAEQVWGKITNSDPATARKAPSIKMS